MLDAPEVQAKPKGAGKGEYNSAQKGKGKGSWNNQSSQFPSSYQAKPQHQSTYSAQNQGTKRKWEGPPQHANEWKQTQYKSGGRW